VAGVATRNLFDHLKLEYYKGFGWPSGFMRNHEALIIKALCVEWRNLSPKAIEMHGYPYNKDQVLNLPMFRYLNKIATRRVELALLLEGKPGSLNNKRASEYLEIARCLRKLYLNG